MALHAIEQEACHFHRGPVSECEDDDRNWFPQLSVCQPTMQQRAAQRRWEKLHEERPWHNGDFTIWHDKQTKATPFYYLDGVTIWVAAEDHNLGGDFLEYGSAQP